MLRPTVYTIPARRSFADALAAGVIDRYATDPFDLSRVTILLPNRRACRSLEEAFLRASGGKPLLMPLMRSFEDVEEEELGLEEAGLAAVGLDVGGTPGVLELAPAINKVRRRFLLARYIMAQAQATGLGPTEPAQAVALAADLARLLDQTHTEKLSFNDLADLVTGELSNHWQITLDFLKVVSETWPTVLEAEGSLDGALRRNLLLEALTERWEAAPPEDPIIAAGSTGSIPATANLLKCVANLPSGAVVLPGLDQHMDAESWAALDHREQQTHPQWGLKALLSHFRMDREEVQEWTAPPVSEGPAEREILLSEAMRPASTTEKWRHLEPFPPEALAGVSRMDCPTPQEEAAAIALLLRETLEEPQKTAALITPDRNLARRVAAELKRWDIQVDDSAGVDLMETPVGAFFRLTAALTEKQAAPHDLLATLKHPLAAGGQTVGAFRQKVRLLERTILRGPRPGPGFAGLVKALESAKHCPEGLLEWLKPLAALFRPFEALVSQGRHRVEDLLQAHVAVMEALATTENEPGVERLWRGEAGEALNSFVADVLEHGDALTDLEGLSYAALMESLMKGLVVRPRYGTHPRLFIWGTVEARLQRANRLILAGLNEGIWPPDPKPDPWMSRPMRGQFGLPLPERRIGLSAHDFVQACAAPEVILVRADKADGAPTVPARWLLRLETLLPDGLPKRDGGALALEWASALDRRCEAPQPIGPPAPKPPLVARPARLSATRVERWMRDPYSIYAQYILGLKKLEEIDQDPTVADRGNFIHEALEGFVKAYRDHLPSDAYRVLESYGKQAFEPLKAWPTIEAFWWPRFQRIARWFVDYEAARRERATPVLLEEKGELILHVDGAPPFKLEATADRIDRFEDGSYSIVDYKTGTPPSTRNVVAGLSPQLPLEALIAQEGGFPDLDPAKVGELLFLHLSGGAEPGKAVPVKADASDLAEAAREGLEALIAAFADPKTPYLAQPRPDYAPQYNDYAHLSRVAEWGAASGEDA